MISELFQITPPSGAYELGPDSQRKVDTPKGTITEFLFTESNYYPSAEHKFWVYVPFGYDDRNPLNLMFFQDGEAYLSEQGQVRVGTVLDNLIEAKEIPLMAAIFVNPGTSVNSDTPQDLREIQYRSTDRLYGSFLLDEISSLAGKEFNFSNQASDRAICGMSDGGLCAFNAAWLAPQSFGKVVSHIGSFTHLGGALEYPSKVRRSRSAPKPIRVFIQDGISDLSLEDGDWSLANLSMVSALRFARYDYATEIGFGGHDLAHAGAIFPETLRWLWRDHPGIANQFSKRSASDVLGDWAMSVNFFGEERPAQLQIESSGEELIGKLRDASDGELKLIELKYHDGLLLVRHEASPYQKTYLKAPHDEQVIVSCWLKHFGDRLEGTCSAEQSFICEYFMVGTRYSK